jgi:L-threonylcarbamoyladenylate synthase
MARSCCSDWPETASQLAAAFWPGPLTLVLPRSPAIPDVVTAGGETVGIRWPGHPFMQAVIRECGFPLAAPSANPANQVSPTNASHVRKSLGAKVGLIVDGGQSQVGIESTVIDLTQPTPTVLRPGMIHLESIAAALGRRRVLGARAGIGAGLLSEAAAKEGVLRSPGQLRKHYSPKASLAVLEWRDDADLRVQLAQRKCPLDRTHIIAHTCIPLGGEFGGVSVIPHDADAFARAIYAELHYCDEAGAEWIIVEALPSTAEWQGIADRLHRAQGLG